MRDVLLSCSGLTKRFGGLAAVNQVTLDWARDEIHAVIGPNGAGKSTLSHLLAGDLPSTEGRIILAGQDVTAWTAERRSHLAGAQLPENQYIPAAFGLGQHPFGRPVAPTTLTGTPHGLVDRRRVGAVRA